VLPVSSARTLPATLGDDDFHRLLIEGVKDYGIFALDPEGRVATWSAGAERLFGYTAREIVGDHFGCLLPAADVEANKCQIELEGAVRDGRFEDEGWRTRKDGSRFWASSVVTPLYRGGALVGFAKVTRDLTERKFAEEEARRYRLLVESVKDYGIFILDPGGHVMTWNIGAARLKGYHAHEIIGRHFSQFYPREDVEAGKCEMELEGAVRDGRFEDEGWRVRKDGSRFWANVIITALFGDGGEHIGFAKVTRDLTERKQTEEKLRALAAENAALEERARLQEFQERFIGILGHDLRNPLAAIEMGAALLDERAGDEAVNRVARRMLSSTHRMSRMIEQILDLTRSRLVGGMRVQPAEMDLCSMLTAIVDELRAAHPGRAVELSCGPLHGRWDRDRLEQVFSNLIGNALHYGAVSAPVVVSARTTRGAVEIDVHNVGDPIPEVLRAQIFDPFRRGERESRRSQTQGLGLGLYISREIVRAHGGDIDVSSSPSAGTTFCVRLPRQTPAREEG
jgi:PAS domain S-box-containing protein